MRLCALAALVFLLPAASYATEIGIASEFADWRVYCPPYVINPYKVIGAAHRTLPCGTVVEVTNLRNGRKAEAKIVDHGPHIKGRIFDMLPLLSNLIRSDGLTKVLLKVK